MAREGLLSWSLTAIFGIAGLLAIPQRGLTDERDEAVAATLAVQTALQQGRDYLMRNDAKSAVFVLESQLARINGNPLYLAVLRDAYRAYLQDLRLANQEALYKVYLQRLQVLDPGAGLDLKGPAPMTAVATAPTPTPAPAPAPAAGSPAPARPEPIIRATMEEIDDEPLVKPASTTSNLISQAEVLFGNRRYKEAGALFEQANRAQPIDSPAGKERWAYCKLYRVVEEINGSAGGSPNWAALEKEVQQAIELAPRLDYAKYLLSEIRKRQQEVSAQPTIAVKHFERGADGWCRTESASFRIFHNQPRELAEQVAQIAERTRSQMLAKWFGCVDADWNPPCDIYLHATVEDYTRATGVPSHSPGHSSIRSEGSRVLHRRIDLRCDEAAMVLAVLPHETTHVILAGKFGEKPVPRWADEGMAVLTEPPDRIERHLRNLPQLRQEGQLFQVAQLMQLNDYPEPNRITAFYAQSVSLVEFMTEQKGPQVFSRFLTDALRGGYEPALQKHYGMRSFAELQQAWTQRAFGGPTTASNVMRPSP